jgi:chitinase
MKQFLYFFTLLALFAIIFNPLPLSARTNPKQIIAYLFPRGGIINPDEVAAERLTHINYAFANIKDGVIVEGSAHDRENFQVLNSLKKRNPGLKLLVSVGGWSWSGGFSDMALSSSSRKKFIASAAQFMHTYDLDGLDVDWEYPGLPGNGNINRPEDKQNFTLFLQELRQQFKREEKKARHHLYITIAAGAFQHFIDHAEMKQVQKPLDFVNLMTYDFYTGADAMTGHHAALYLNPDDPRKNSTDTTVKAYLRAGVPPKKLVIGAAFYGRAWQGVEPVNQGLYQPGKVAQLPANYRNIVDTYLDQQGFLPLWDKAAAAPFLWNESRRIWISYEDEESIKLKGQYVLSKKLGGIMFWEYYGDKDNRLLKSINAVLGPKVK